MHPLGGKTIKIPEIPKTLTTYAVNLLLNLRWGKFFMPRGIGLLVTALSSADLLGDVDFAVHVAEILHVHPRKLTLSCDIFKVVRDRYRLARICMLSPSNNLRCGFCHDYFSGSEILLDTTYCGRKIHMICYYEKARACPYCGEAFYPTKCCVCKTDIRETYTTPQKKIEKTMKCCTADVHQYCMWKLYNNNCPCCGAPLRSDGTPKPPKNVEEYVFRRRQLRRNERLRAGISLQ